MYIVQGVLTLKKTHFEPRYILTLPLSAEVSCGPGTVKTKTLADIPVLHARLYFYISHFLSLFTQAHRKRLQEKGCYTEEQMTAIVSKGELYKQIHLDNPGFFDTSINTGT